MDVSERPGNWTGEHADASDRCSRLDHAVDVTVADSETRDQDCGPARCTSTPVRAPSSLGLLDGFVSMRSLLHV